MKIEVEKASSRKKNVPVEINNTWQEYIDYTDEQMAQHIELCRKREEEVMIDWDKAAEDISRAAAKVQKSLTELADMFRKISS